MYLKDNNFSLFTFLFYIDEKRKVNRKEKHSKHYSATHYKTAYAVICVFVLSGQKSFSTAKDNAVRLKDYFDIRQI